MDNKGSPDEEMLERSVLEIASAIAQLTLDVIRVIRQVRNLKNKLMV